MKIIEHRVSYRYGDTIKICPLSDIHYGHKLCDTTALKKFISDNPDALYVGLGDMLDSIVCTDKRYSKAMDWTSGEGIIDEQVENLYAILKPIAGQIIGLGEGNHERVYTDRTNSNPTRRLAQMLNVPYLGYTWIVRLVLHEDNTRIRTVLVYGHHGWGGGTRTMGGDLTKYSKIMSYYDCDVFLFGHTHNLQTHRIERLALTGNKLIAKPKHLAITGTWMKTISPDEIPSWAETKGFAPARIGCPTISIRPNGTWADISITT